MRISDWSSDVCSSDLLVEGGLEGLLGHNGLSTKGGSWAIPQRNRVRLAERLLGKPRGSGRQDVNAGGQFATFQTVSERGVCGTTPADASEIRSEEHTSELQSLMRISYAVFCLKKKKKTTT